MNEDIEQPNNDAQKAKSTTGATGVKHDDQKKKEDKHEKPADKKADKGHGHHA
jgi:hypothetical protein